MAEKIIMKKGYEIILLLYICRFIHSKKIQEFMNHKDYKRICGLLSRNTTSTDSRFS